jgi:hypothetical protein
VKKIKNKFKISIDNIYIYNIYAYMGAILFKGFKEIENITEEELKNLENDFAYFVYQDESVGGGYIFLNGKKYCIGLKPEEVYYDEKEYYGTYERMTFTEQQDVYYLSPNIYYSWFNCIPTYIVFKEPQISYLSNEYIFIINVPENLSNYTLKVTIGGNGNLSWANDDVPDFEAGYTYEISVIGGYATYNKFETLYKNV